MEHGDDKGSTDPSEREIDVPNGKTLSVFLRKHWTTGREVKKVVELHIGLT